MSHFLENSLDLPLKELLPIIQDRISHQTTYFGIETLKSPIDYWVYQEIIYEQQPDVILEIGNHCGGSALALAHLCDLLGHGRVIGVDISHQNLAESAIAHPRIKFIEGDACLVFDEVQALIEANDSVLIIEDSSHTYENTLNVLTTYAQFIPPGGYFIVEDGICHHGLEIGPNPGPYEAIETFIEQNHDFEIDRSRESFLITWNPKGYLRRKGNALA